MPRRRPAPYVLSTFFVGIIPAVSLGWLNDQLRAIAAIPATDPIDNDRVRGLFFVHHDAEGRAELQIRDGELHILPGDPRHDYLDA